MNGMLLRQRTALWLGVAGAALGLVAGVVQATLGAQIPEWSGYKNNPFGLGVLTVSLCLVALVGAVTLGRIPLPTPHRLAAAMGLLIPGLLCFTTVGVLWYLPGGLLLAATVLAVRAGETHESRHFVVTHWLSGLVSVLGLFELMLAVGTGAGWMAAIGIVGGIAVVLAPWVPSKLLRMTLLTLGTVPFALLTWWSIASPLLAVIALGLGAVATRRRTPVLATGRDS
ncbi:MFS family permease [Arthrobacter sp. GAS37]|uniref:hypothetical protein n=1 Tax=Arthrobacter sp. GAS37 TaxID=3156261 RepID=UPI0038394B99